MCNTFGGYNSTFDYSYLIVLYIEGIINICYIIYICVNWIALQSVLFFVLLCLTV